MSAEGLLGDALAAASANLILLVLLPGLGYLAFHRWKHRRSLGEIARRLGLGPGDLRFAGYGALLAAVSVGALLVFTPDLEPFARPESAQHRFVGLGLGPTSILLALIYGFVQTGFAEEFFFRGLVAGSIARRAPLRLANALQGLAFLAPHVLILDSMPELRWALALIFVLALALGWLRLRSGSILGPWLVHGAGNTTMALLVATRVAG